MELATAESATMLNQESESPTQNAFDPVMNRHRPASEKTQDISHVLASIFKDLYTAEVIGKDTVANLTKSRRGGNSYHDRYVEELQQIHLEYNRRMNEADMLEKHILKARLQASAKEERVYNNIVEEVGDAYHQLGLPPVKSTFKWCVDNSLLKSNNLICPEDYITEEAPLIKPPRGKLTPGFAKTTVCFDKHINRLPQDDGYTEIPPPDRMAQSMLKDSEETLMLPSTPESSTLSQNKPNGKPSQDCRPTWMGGLSESRRAEERAALLKLKERHNFLRNPRFLPPHAHRGGKSLILPPKRAERLPFFSNSSPEEPVPVFLANPPIVFFTDYRVGQVYETTVELRNMTATSRHARVIPPTTPNFSIGLGKFPGEGGTVAPGMSCQYTIRFAPDSLADFEDFILVETQAPYPLVVPIEARRPPPILTLPSVLDCGYCLVGGVKIVEFLCQNEGLSDGTFCIMPKRLWPASNLRSVVTGSFAEQPPFGVSPCLFDLLPGQATMVEVAFFPTAPGSCSQVFTIVCDNCQVKDITIQGTGQLIALELVSVTGGEDRPALGELCDLTAEHFIRFGSANPHFLLQKTLVIRNNAHLELPFHWQIMKPNLQDPLLEEEQDPAHIQYQLATEGVFDISPQVGSLAPHQDHEFLLSYCPLELKEYHSVCHLVVRDIPDPPKEPDDKGTPQHLEVATNVNDVIVMEIEVKGSTEPYKVLLEPYAIHFPGETFIGTAIRKRFKMWNNSKSCIQFQWDRLCNCHIMEVEPPVGEIEMNECCDLELVLTGGKPGPFVTSLLCHIQYHCQPVALAVEATFKGPKLSISVPSLDLGLMKLGDQAQSSIQITNNTQLEASWIFQEQPEGRDNNEMQISIEPHRGVLPPLASCSVDVLFRPVACRHFETILELAVENGTGCHLSVQADVQSPSVCLLSCELAFPELYVGVSARGTVTLFNQTLLPAHFSWGKLQGKQASLCSACFSPPTGTLGPNAQMEVGVEFTAHTDVELTEVAAICEVKGMQEPLVLGFSAKAKGLHVSYSLPPDCPTADSQDSSALVLDFGSDVVLRKAVTKQLMITNHTAIPAPFHLEAEYFTGRPTTPTPPGGADSRHQASCLRRQLHPMQVKKAEEKEHQDFVNSLLAHGKGAAFFVQPAAGTLGPFETQTVDITAFTNMWGDYRDHLICKVGDLEPEAIPIKMSVRGCPIYFQMMGPQLEAQTQGPIIRFGAHVSGGDTVSRSLRLNNTSPYNIRMDWETYNQEKGDRKLVDLVVWYGEAFPLKDADGNEVLRGRLGSSQSATPSWDWSHTPCSSRTSSSLRSECQQEEDEDEEETGITHPLTPLRKLISVHLRPHEGNVSDYPYCITPQQIVVPAGGSSTIHVSFTPLTFSGPTSDPMCFGFALGFMSLDCKAASCIPGKVERAQGFELEPLRLDLQASVKPALLSVQMEEEEDALEFCAIASDLIQCKVRDSHNEQTLRESVRTRNFQLKNTTQMRLYFKLSTQPPFSILLPQNRGRTGSSSHHPEEPQSLILRPQHNLQVKVAFHNSPSLLTYQSQASEQLPSTVQLIHTDTGERKLQFQQNLSIEYSNNSVQMVPLMAHLSLPTLYLSDDTMDFGTCYVGQTHIKEVFLCNRGGSCSHWTAFVVDGETSPFRVTPGSGVLEHRVGSCRQPLQISFIPSDQGESRATIRVQGILGEPPIQLLVQGKGSFDERYVSLLADE
ncbi:deleted in lung and esophageal cancer protein 1 [Megalops cyprinoides]|uniref:deleted in lung and esophageal cancer protein 1 n=1 Tax=Megalops cyprinoides TaxID=118141 RepID=UPI0018647BDB|nr:deleted in lung and esophageal cancer protein 1 [Megalops cyprinoides]